MSKPKSNKQSILCDHNSSMSIEENLLSFNDFGKNKCIKKGEWKVAWTMVGRLAKWMDNGWEPWTIVWRLDKGMKTGEAKGDWRMEGVHNWNFQIIQGCKDGKHLLLKSQNVFITGSTIATKIIFIFRTNEFIKTKIETEWRRYEIWVYTYSVKFRFFCHF